MSDKGDAGRPDLATQRFLPAPRGRVCLRPRGSGSVVSPGDKAKAPDAEKNLISTK